MTPKQLAEIKARCDAATEGEWGWFDMGRGPILASRRRGRLIIMDFVRKGMNSAQPRFAKRTSSDRCGILYKAEDIDLELHPDSDFIAHARQDLPDCIAEIERLQGLVKSAHREGFASIEGFATYDADDELWAASESRKVLEAEQTLGTDAEH